MGRRHAYIEAISEKLGELETQLHDLADAAARVRDESMQMSVAQSMNEFLAGLSRSQSALLSARRALDTIEDPTIWDPTKSAPGVEGRIPGAHRAYR
jgi:phage shock protein A